MNTTKARALVLAVALTLGAVVAAPHNASAEAVPRPDVTKDVGWVTATLYFNKSETRSLAAHTWSASAACALVAAKFGGWYGFACMLFGPRIVWGATRAKDNGNCVGIRWVILNPPSIWTVEHDGWRCT